MVGEVSVAIDGVELIEFHDAVVERIEMRPDGEVRVAFSHLAVYRRETTDSLGVWSFRAELRLLGIKSFTGEGVLSSDARPTLEDATIADVAGSPIEASILAGGGDFALGSVELTWALCGARVVFRGGTVSLHLLEPLRRVETWIGDL